MVDGFHTTPLLHFIADSHSASYSLKFFILYVIAGQARKSPASYRYCLAFRQGFQFLVSGVSGNLILCISHHSPCQHNRGEPIRVAGVVVVDIAARVDIPRIIRIATVSRPQPNVLSINLHPDIVSHLHHATCGSVLLCQSSTATNISLCCP